MQPYIEISLDNHDKCRYLLHHRFVLEEKLSPMEQQLGHLGHVLVGYFYEAHIGKHATSNHLRSCFHRLLMAIHRDPQ
jgi:hypothetical protein